MSVSKTTRTLVWLLLFGLTGAYLALVALSYGSAPAEDPRPPRTSRYPTHELTEEYSRTIVRAVLEELALGSREDLERLERIRGRAFARGVVEELLFCADEDLRLEELVHRALTADQVRQSKNRNRLREYYDARPDEKAELEPWLREVLWPPGTDLVPEEEVSPK